MRSVVSVVHEDIVKRGDDNARVEYVELFLSQAKAIRKLGPQACDQYLDGTINIAAALPKEYAEAEQAWLIATLKRSMRTTPKRSAGMKDSAIRESVSRIPKRFVPVIAEPDKYRGQTLRCDAVISLYESVLSLPPNLKAAALDGMLR